MMWISGAAAVIGLAYLMLTILSLREFLARKPGACGAAWKPSVSVLKPVCGWEPDLYENLHSFCTQNYAGLQIIFGVRDRHDGALPVIRRLIAELPDVQIDLVIDRRIHGANLKVSNLINMMRVARHDVLVIADSDIWVEPGYLSEVVAPLADPGVGIVTCLYTGIADGGFWSRVGAAYINVGFLPSVLAGQRLRAQDGCFGGTIAMTRASFEAIGGFEPLKDKLADDHALGAMVRLRGQKVVISRYVVRTSVGEITGRALLAHELRWARTIRMIAGSAFAGSLVTYPAVWATLYLACAAGAGAVDPSILIAFGAILTLRGAQGLYVESALKVPRSTPWLVLFRDFMSFSVVAAAFFGRHVEWRGRVFRVTPEGDLIAMGSYAHEEELVSAPPVL